MTQRGSEEVSDSERNVEVTITMPRLAMLLVLETAGLGVLVWGLLEVYIFGGNPVKPEVMLHIGAVIITTASVWTAKIYQGPGILGFINIGREN